MYLSQYLGVVYSCRRAYHSGIPPFLGQVHVDLRQELWATIDEEIDVKNCEIFSYNPDLSGGEPMLVQISLFPI